MKVIQTYTNSFSANLAKGLLEDAGIGHILVSKNRQRWLVRECVDCDLYRILAGDPEAGRTYAGEYLREYSWAESTNARLTKLLNYVEN